MNDRSSLSKLSRATCKIPDTCATCGEMMKVGSRIRLIKDRRRTSGWSHVICPRIVPTEEELEVSHARMPDSPLFSTLKERQRGLL